MANIYLLVNKSYGAPEVARSIGTDWMILTMQSLVTVVNISGIVLLGRNMRTFSKIKIFHVNMRLQYLNIGFALMVRSLLMTSRAVGVLIVAISAKNSSDFFEDDHECNMEMSFTTGFMNIFICSIFAFCVERAVATVFASTYQRQHFTYVGLLLVFFAWSLDSYEMIIAIMVFFKSSSNGNHQLPYCSSVTASGRQARNFIRSMMPMSELFLSAVVLVITFLVTRKKLKLNLNTNTHNLSTRFEQHQILAASQLMFPTVLTATIVLLVGLVSSGATQLLNPATLVHVARIKEFFSLITAPPLLILFPVLFDWRYTQLLKSREKNNGQRFSPGSQMTHLQSFWERS